ncbi:hypothetical protein AAF712_010054 [Marasmius tenuissimus]|uniref:Uncharacterized protein n=1 Tax=Marasmius tenuissimus TaxID=585030 RepID=A0ABR2ZPM6_9AGAR
MQDSLEMPVRLLLRVRTTRLVGSLRNLASLVVALMPPPPSPSPGMKQEGTPDSGGVGPKDGIKAEGSPRGNLNAGPDAWKRNRFVDTRAPAQRRTPSAASFCSKPGFTATYPNAGPGGIQGGMLGMNPSPLPNTLQNPPSQNQPPQPQMQLHDMFDNQFLSSVTSHLEDLDGGLFRPDGDINFERDFGQWFNHPDDVSALDIK